VGSDGATGATGSSGINGQNWVNTVKTSDYTIVDTVDRYKLFNAGTRTAAINFTLPASPSTSECYTITDGYGYATLYPVVVKGNGKLIQGAPSYTMSQNFESMSIFFDGTRWILI
jgi:hypothetical protein